MQLDAWRLKLPKMCSFWRFCYFFYHFALNASKFILATDKNLLFPAKIDYIGKEWMQLDGSRLKLTRMFSLWQFLVTFPLLCYRFIKVSSFCPHTKLCIFRQKLIFFGYEWMQIVAWKLKLPRMYSLWRVLLIFPTFCDRLIEVISFWSPSKICNFRQKLAVFG